MLTAPRSNTKMSLRPSAPRFWLAAALGGAGKAGCLGNLPGQGCYAPLPVGQESGIAEAQMPNPIDSKTG
jgi:hypothetical protein